MTTADKLRHIIAHCAWRDVEYCKDCKLELGTTCPKKQWRFWTDEEIETAYNILFPDSKEPEFVKAGYIKDEAHERFMNIGNAEVERKVETMVNPDATQSYDTVNHPNHYCKGGIECIDAIKASMTSDGFCEYCKGNVLKYIWRWRDKGGAEDLEKARVYLNWIIEEAKK